MASPFSYRIHYGIGHKGLHHSSVLALRHSKGGIDAFVGWLIGQHNLVVRYPEFHQLVGYAALGTIVLNPDFAIFDVHMDETAILATILGPTRMHELVMVALRIKNQLQFHLTIGRLVSAMLPNHCLNVLAILV